MAGLFSIFTTKPKDSSLTQKVLGLLNLNKKVAPTPKVQIPAKVNLSKVNTTMTTPVATGYTGTPAPTKPLISPQPIINTAKNVAKTVVNKIAAEPAINLVPFAPRQVKSPTIGDLASRVKSNIINANSYNKEINRISLKRASKQPLTPAEDKKFSAHIKDLTSSLIPMGGVEDVSKKVAEQAIEKSGQIVKDEAGNVINKIFPKKPQELNVNRLNLSDLQKEHVVSLESNEIRKTLGDNTVKDIARSAGLDTKTYNIDQQAQKIAEQLNVRRNIVSLENQVEQLKSAGGDSGQIENLTKQIADQSRVSRTQGTFMARSLAARRIIANELDTPMQRVFKLLDNAGVNPDKYIPEATKVDFNNPGQVVDFYRSFVPASAWEWLDALRYNSMLSSPLTHIVNVSSNAVMSGVVSPITKSLTGAFDFLGNAATGGQRKAFVGEGPAYAKGYMGNMRQAADNFIDVMRGAKGAENLDLSHAPLAVRGKAKHVASFLEFPMKLLEGADQFFTALTEGGEKASLLYRQAKGGKIPGDIAQTAAENARYTLFRGKLGTPGQGKLLDAIDTIPKQIMQLRNSNNPLVKTVARFTFPFIGTPTNIIKQSFEYSPLGLGTMWGNTNKTAQAAKAVMGTVATAATAMLLGTGRLSWAQPTDPKEKAAFQAAGIQPYSVKMGDKWVSYQRLPPVIAFNVAMVAALNDAFEKGKINQNGIDAFMGAVSRFGNFWTDQSYLKQLGDTLAAIKGDPEKFSSALSNLPQQVFPLRAFSGWIARMTDQYQRKINTDKGFVDQQVQQFMMQIPGLREKLDTRTNADGQPLKAQNPFLNAFSPASVSSENPKGKQAYGDLMLAKKLRSQGIQQSAEEKTKVGKIYEDLKKLSPGEANARVNSLDDKTYLALKKYMSAAALTPEAKQVKSLSVENGARARYIYEKTQKMGSTKEKNDYIDSLGGLVNDDVYNQLQELIKTPPSKDNRQSLLSPFVPQAQAAEGGTAKERFQPLVESAATEQGVPANILGALLQQESGYNPDAKSQVGAQGIAQFMPETARGMGIDPLNPDEAIPAAAKYLKQLYDEFGSWELALAAYNAGSKAVKQYGGIPPYAETQNYVKDIMSMAGN